MSCCEPASSDESSKTACCEPSQAADPREGVRDRYAAIAEKASQGDFELAISQGGCCGGSGDLGRRSLGIGYSTEELDSIPREADMGLGCGNPAAIALLQQGETVLDLGSGGGIDCFLAAKKVGEKGHVIGVDMTPQMISKARTNAEKLGTPQVEFRLGEIEHLPVADETVDVVISNCVINLSPHKDQVYAEVFRILKPGGRFCVSDILALETLSEEVRNDIALRSCCIGGAETEEFTRQQLSAAGFIGISFIPKQESADYVKEWDSNSDAGSLVLSYDIFASKGQACAPGSGCC
jgi:SAM-dependent methyltransferase